MSSALSGQTILLTGGSGMVGQNLIEAAQKQPVQLLAPSSRELDLLKRDSVIDYLREHKPDVIVHAAGTVGGIQANLAQPVKFLVDNTLMGIHLLTAAQAVGTPRVINLGSSCMYPRAAANPLAESVILQGELEPTNEGYALAKCTAARLCEYIGRESPDLSYKTLIPCNLYGRHDNFEPHNSHMLPAVIRKLDEARRSGASHVKMWGDGEARREFMCAADLAEFVFVALARFEELPQNLNVGLGHDYTINEYYRAIAEVVGFTGEIRHDLTKPVGMKQKLIDDTLLRQFGWQHNTSLKAGLKNTYKFYLGTHCND